MSFLNALHPKGKFLVISWAQRFGSTGKSLMFMQWFVPYRAVLQYSNQVHNPFTDVPSRGITTKDRSRTKPTFHAISYTNQCFPV
jgi:hypothetical protein